MSALKPRSTLRQTRTRMQFLNGIYIGQTPIKQEILDKIDAVNDLIDAVNDLPDIGPFIDGVTGRLEAIEERLKDVETTGYIDISYKEEGNVDWSVTPTDDIDFDLDASSEYAILKPGGSTNFNLTFRLPLPIADMAVYRIDYDKGSHAGSFTVESVELTGSGTTYFFWCDGQWQTWSDDKCTLVVPDRCDGLLISLEDAGDTNTITIQLPTDSSNRGHLLGLIINSDADTGTACKVALDGVIVSGSGISNGIEELPNGFYLLYCITPGMWMSFAAADISSSVD